MIQPEDATIIIPHLGGTSETEFALRHCLKSLKETSKSRIIVAHNNVGGWDGPVDPSTLLLFDQGQCKAVNAAAATVDTEWLLITNDDMIYAPGWFENLTKVITTEKCVSPKLVEPRPGAPTFEVYFCGGAGGDFDKQKWLDFARAWHNRTNFLPLRTGFNLPFLIKKELWDLVGGYDVNYDPWGSNSDSDLEYKIKLAGVQPYQNPNSVVYHFSQTSGTFEPRNAYFWHRNFAYFEKKWGFSRTDEGIWEANFTIPSFRDGRLFRPFWEGFYERS